MTVEEFVAAEARKPFRRWDTDCIGIVEKWINRRTGLSLFVLSGEPCTTEDDALAWLDKPAQILRAMERGMRACGFTATKSPRNGDVGIVHDGTILHIAIRGRSLWLTRHHDGIAGLSDAQVVRAWGVG